MHESLLRRLPAVTTVKSLPAMASLVAEAGEAYVTDRIRAEIELRREALRAGRATAAPTAEDIAAAVADRIEREDAPPISPVINATGVIIHTNLGRACLAPEAVAALTAAAAEPGALEFDLETGARGHRDRVVEALLCELTGAEAATVVNNNAAAVLIVLDTVAKGREVIISRGELVEIGGSFRVPDVLRRSGATLVEVGTTNKTRLGDYEGAITPNTAAVMKVHASNFRTVGFTEEAARGDLAALATHHRIYAIEDLGSGALLDLRPCGLTGEPVVSDSVRAGMHMVTFSGDKLLGGPQAGCIVGAAPAIAAVRKNPLMRALRPDKLTLAALAATLRLYRTPDKARARIPVLAALHREFDEVAAQAELLANHLQETPGLTVQVCESAATVGGGAAPGLTLRSAAVLLAHATLSADELATALRAQRPAVVGRIADDAVWLDQRTVPPAAVAALVAGVRAAVGA